jgi:hypothetical protein
LICILLQTMNEKLREKKFDFLVKLKELIGEQKIDVILATDGTRTIEKEAIKTGILL